jgi:hypothetical protein
MVDSPMSAPASSDLPRAAPILPGSRPGAFNDPAFLLEPNHDGFRGLVSP